MKQLPDKDQGIENTVQTGFLNFKGRIARRIRVSGEDAGAPETQLKRDFPFVSRVCNNLMLNASAHLRRFCKRKERNKKRHLWR